MKKVLVVIAILVAAAACGGAGSASTAAGPALKAPSAGGASSSGAPTTINGQPGTTNPSGSGTTNPSGSDTTNPGGTGTTVPVLQGPPVIREAQLTMSVGAGTFDSKLSLARSIVESEGGYIAGTQAQTAPADTEVRTGVLNFMVPAANFDVTIDEISKIGKVQNEQITGTEVSGQYVDLQARLANAQAQRAAMLTLLTQAKTISDIIAVQNQIGQITGTIEQLEGQIKYLDDHTSFSALTITMTEAAATAQAPAPADSWGFKAALSDAAHNFVATINYIVVGLGVLGPFILLGGLGYLLWRRRSSWLPRHA
ncbi:MAG TPA: DUF4349 domain-containing protein [Candidatus Acidoferrum sp.]|jgi:hypothetical protein|nr:DUF4349 domain-containing protein [Candidatus Acidoferrum sp.]